MLSAIATACLNQRLVSSDLVVFSLFSILTIMSSAFLISPLSCSPICKFYLNSPHSSTISFKNQRLTPHEPFDRNFLKMPIATPISEIRLAEGEEIDNGVRAPVVGEGEGGD